MKQSILFLFIFFSSFSFASTETDFITSVERLPLAQLTKLESEYDQKKEGSFSENHLRLKIIQFYISVRQDRIDKHIEILIWLTHNQKIQNKEYLTWAYYHLSTLLTYYKIYDLAIEQNKKCIRLAKEVKNQKILYDATSNLATIYFKTEDFQRAKNHFEQTYLIPYTRAPYLFASDLNNIALCYQKLHNYTKAIEVYKEALNLLPKQRTKSDDEIFYLVSGNLGATYLQDNHLDEGFNLLREELNYYVKNNMNGLNQSSCFIEIIRYHKKKGNLAVLPGLIDQTLNSIHLIDNPEEKLQIIEKLIRLIQKERIPCNELQLNKEYNSILIQSNLEFQTIQKSISKLLYEDKIDQLIRNASYEKQNHELEQKNKNTLVLSSVIIIIALLTLMIIVIKNTRQRLIHSQQTITIQQQQEKIVRNEQILLQQQLQNQKQQLNSLLTNLSIKQNTESGFLEKIKELKRKKNMSPEQIIQELQLSINNLIDIDKKLIADSIVNFELNKDFSDRLLQKHPALTDYEIRYCNYFIAGLSSKEIGLLHNLSDVSVRVLKNKIKRKLQLGKDELMIDYLKSFI